MISQLFEPASYQYTIYAIPGLAVALTLLVLGSYTFIQNRKSFLNISFLGATIIAAIWLSGTSAIYMLKDAEFGLLVYKYYTFFGVSFIAPSIYFVSVSALRLLKKNKNVVLISYVLGFVFYLLNLTTDRLSAGIREYSFGNYIQYGPLGYPFMAFLFVVFLLCFYHYFCALKKKMNVIEKERTRLLFISLLIAYFGSCDFIPAIGIDFYPFGYLPVLIFIIIQFYAIFKIRLTITMREIYDSMHDGVIVIDKHERIIDTNTATKRILGCQKIVGRKIVEVFPLANKLLDELKATSHDAIDKEILYEMPNSEVDDRILNVTASWIGDEDSGMLGTLLVLRDITERKKMTMALQESEERYSAIVRGSNDGIVILKGAKLGGKVEVVFSNQKVANLTGYSIEEIYQLNFLRAIRPEYLFRAIDRFRRRLAGEDLPPRFEIEIIRKDGHIVPVELSGTWIEYEGERALLIFIHDISERKQAEEALKASEERLKILFEYAPDAIYLHDLKGNFVDGNKAAEELIGYKREELIGKNFLSLKLLPKDQVIRLGLSMAKGNLKELSATQELSLNKKDGTRVPVEIRVFPLKIHDESLVLGIARNVTERKKAEVELKKTLEDLKNSNKELEQFAYIASHDLQEPLRLIGSYVQLLSKRYKSRLDSDADEFIDYAVQGAKSLQERINSLLEFSRVGTKGKPFDLTDCETALENAIENLTIAIEENSAMITHDPMPTVMADDSQLVTLFQNLIENAILYRRKDRLRIHISCEQKDGEWVFSVADNGIGIDMEYKEYIFLIYRVLNKNRQGKGTGIGLAVCKKIVDRHGGKIWVESEQGRGSTFYFTIPIKNEFALKIEGAKR